MDQAARGKKALAEGRYTEAIADFTAALKISPTSPDYLTQRSVANQRAKNYPEALADANNAVLNAQKRAKREAIVEGQFRRGVALYSLERYGDAEFVFGIVERLDPKHKMLTVWAHKTTNSLQKLDEYDDRRKCGIQETPSAEESITPQSSHATVSDAVPTAPAPVVMAQQTTPDKIRHEWYQNSENIYFTLLAKGVPKDKAQIDIQERSLSVSFPLANGSSYDLTLEPLFGPVNPEKCITRFLSTKIEIILSKANPGPKWSALESSEPLAVAASADVQNGQDAEAVKSAVLSNTTITAPGASGPAYPTSSKSGPKDWDKITKNLRTGDNSKSKDGSGDSGLGEDMDDDDDQGGDPANAFFKKLFKNASPETQRAMMKSYTESNGTALSTNWEEVSKGTVETVPPDGMEARKW